MMRRFLFVVFQSLLTLASAAAQDARPDAQSAPAPFVRPPIQISGFGYARSDNLHVYTCEDARCLKGSRVILRFLPASDKLMTLDEFRAGQEVAARALAPRVAKVEILQSEASGGPEPPAQVKLVTRQTDGNGAVEYSNAGLIMGQRAFVSLVSSSPLDFAAEANYGLFATGALMLIGQQSQQGGGSK